VKSYSVKNDACTASPSDSATVRSRQPPRPATASDPPPSRRSSRRVHPFIIWFFRW